jgi:hypothetical protein
MYHRDFSPQKREVVVVPGAATAPPASKPPATDPPAADPPAAVPDPGPVAS